MKVIQLRQTRSQIYSERCQAYMNQKLYDEAIGDCQKSLDLNPKVMESHWNLFLAYLVAKKDQEAEQELKITKELGEKIKNPVLIDKLINAYSQTGNWHKVVEVLEQEIKNKPTDALLYAKLAVA